MTSDSRSMTDRIDLGHVRFGENTRSKAEGKIKGVELGIIELRKNISKKIEPTGLRIEPTVR
jgi:hypothetical protein